MCMMRVCICMGVGMYIVHCVCTSGDVLERGVGCVLVEMYLC